jgi:hypothetical protein
MAIEHKIAKVSDEVCKTCSQCFEDECRAFSMTHSKEETERRLSSAPKCWVSRHYQLIQEYVQTFQTKEKGNEENK